MDSITITGPIGQINGSVNLPLSKSIANRLLLMSSFENLIPTETENLPRDTEVLKELLQLNSSELDAGQAGSSYRFMLAKCAITPGSWIVKGSKRMHSRPIGPLVEALKKLGADISYLGQLGFPPVVIHGKDLQSPGPIDIPADISSQFISAILMIGPYVKGGIHLKMNGKILSLPYIRMTVSLMNQCGVSAYLDNRDIIAEEGRYRQFPDQVERDWSAASYFLGLPLLQGGGQLKLKGLLPDSIQGDQQALFHFGQLGLQTDFSEGELRIQAREQGNLKGKTLELDFIHQPDLVQTYAAFCLRMGMRARFTSCFNLNLKETNRLDKLKDLVTQLNGIVLEGPEGSLFFDSPVRFSGANLNATFPSWDDHRMAMSLALLSTGGNTLKIENPEVVVKSFPGFWRELSNLGFQMEVK